MGDRRSRCARCQRPLSHCLCAHIPQLDHSTRVLVLQHPDEAKHPLNTARLAVLGLSHAELWVGEQFAELEALIASASQAVLLFPSNDESVTLPAAGESSGTASLLIVPDGTWRKARRIVAMNPVLRTLPHLSLPLGPTSRYRVRRAAEPAAVSTIEAIVRGLAILEPDNDLSTLLRPFDVMVEQQIEAMGEAVYRRNHSADDEKATQQ